jgi:GR25 family glycosyltransferase involved in LPS biosynthesis
MIIEDDAIPLFATSQELNEIVNHHHQEFSHSRIALLHKPARSSPLSEIAVKKHFSLLNRAPWGAYGYVVESKEYDRLRRLYSSLVMPADWYWDKIYAKMKSISISNIPLVEHRSKTTYIGNEFRGQRRKFIK